MSPLRSVRWRLGILLFRRISREDTLTGEITVHRNISWRYAWLIAGSHSYTWCWVKKFGDLSCGCVQNPLTRRVVLINACCRRHFGAPIDVEMDE